jgi:hypothetical protein
VEMYDLLRIVFGVAIALVFLFGVAKPLLIDDSSTLSSAQSKIKSPYCNTDADCSNGVCSGGECVCFLDSQCKASGRCNMGIGLCK